MRFGAHVERPRPSRYLPLAVYLATQEAHEVTLSFAAIERLIGGTLPVSAFSATAYWSSRHYPHVRLWLARGWRGRVAFHERAVIFRRVAIHGEE